MIMLALAHALSSVMNASQTADYDEATPGSDDGLGLGYSNMNSSSSSSSTGPSGLPESAPYSLRTAYLYYVLINVMGFLITGVLFYFIPSTLLSKICTRVLGFEQVLRPVRVNTEGRRQQLETSTTHARDAHQGPSHTEEARSTMMQPLLSIEPSESAAISAAASSSPSSTPHGVSSSSLAPASTVSTSSSSSSRPRRPNHKAAAPRLSNLHMRPVPGRLMVMGDEVQIDAVEYSEITRSRTAGAASGATGFLSRCCGWVGDSLRRYCTIFVPSMCHSRPHGLRVSRIIRRLLWCISTSCLIYLGELTLFTMVQLGVARPSTPEQPEPCPVEVREYYCYTGTSQLVDCRIPGATLPVGDVKLVCFSLDMADWPEAITALSSVAALFTLVFGGMCLVLGWLLQLVHSPRLLSFLHVLSVASMLCVFLAEYYRLSTSLLGYAVPLFVAVTCWSMVGIRRINIEHRRISEMRGGRTRGGVGDEDDDEEGEDSEEDNELALLA